MSDWTEDQRVAALHEHELLDTPSEEVFDVLVQAAARACDAPSAAVTLLAEQRQWFKASVGLSVGETPRADAFCNYTIRNADSDVLIVPDAAVDPRFRDNPLVTGAPHLRFYAGAPIRTAEGLPLGSLCVLDDKAHPQGLSPEQSFLLRTLAEQVSIQLQLRRLARGERELARLQAEELARGRAREARLSSALEGGGVGWFRWDIARDRVSGAAEGALDLGMGHDFTGDGVTADALLAAISPQDRPVLVEAVRDALGGLAPLSEEFRIVDPAGAVRWMSARGRCVYGETGEPVSLTGVVIDVTARKDAELRLREVDMGRELALRAAQLGRWDHRPATGRRFLDARALELFGLQPGQEADAEEVLARVHPDERPAVRAALAQVMDPNRAGPFRMRYRVVDPVTEAVRWIDAYGASQFENGVCTRFFGVLADVTAEQLAAEHRQVLMGELNHRVKNTMALVMSLVMSSLRGMGDADLRASLEKRLVSLGRAHDLLTAENWSAATVPAIVEDAVETLSLPRERLELSGPALRLGPKPALHLALALHELATNAIKYGALSNDTGRVHLAWGVNAAEGDRSFVLTWTERGGPTVRAPERKGFGSRLVQRATAAEFAGSTRLEYRPEGVVWTLRAPMHGLAELGRLTVGELG